jgi:HlyD family secretion protein
MTRNRKFVIGAAVIVVLGGAAGMELLRSDTSISVRTEEIREREVSSTITATGQIRARNQVNISSEVMGRVVSLLVQEGDEVQAGDLLLTIDPKQAEAAVARAQASLSQVEAQVLQQEANFRQAERDLVRQQELHASGVITVQDLEVAETRVQTSRATLTSSRYAVEQSRAALEEATEQLGSTTIRAPLAGKVLRLNIREGETAVVGTMNNAGSLLLMIGDLSEIEAVMVVDETDIPLISVGDSSIVELDAFPDRTFPARVTSIANSSTRTGTTTTTQATGSVTFQVILTLIDPPTDLRPDLSATADIFVEQRDGAIAAPIISVTVRDRSRSSGEEESANETGGEAGDATEPEADEGNEEEDEMEEGVFLVRNGEVVWTPVTLGITGEEYFEVLSGLAVGDTVVSGPYQTIRTLSDGDPVRIVGSSGEATSSQP